MSARYLIVLALLLAGSAVAQDLRQPDARSRWTLVPEIRRQLDGLQPASKPAPVVVALTTTPRDKCVAPLLPMAIPPDVHFSMQQLRPDPRAGRNMPRLELPPVCPLPDGL
jgi:hypothetical protein